jgi:thiosulfate/3-mercaptopyruvate sulfurtransferase
VADAQDVERAMQSGQACLVNALSAEQFEGTGGAHYGRPGRIPGSVSLPARACIDQESGLWQSKETIQSLAQAAGVAPPDHPVIVYCGGGIAATATGFALQYAGWTQVSVYDNSLLEWSADPARPMAQGRA